MRASFRPIFALLLSALLQGCGSGNDSRTEIEFWAMGSEGEQVRPLLPEFERRHPHLKVKVQQIPWSAAHEKLLTAYVGGTLPDVFQIGNTWLPELVAVRAAIPLGRFIAETAHFEPEDFFSGIWASNETHGEIYGIPWYVDTRVLFYRKDILASAGFAAPPKTWDEWRVMMEALKRQGRGKTYPLFAAINEWQIPVILALQTESGLLRDNARHGDFTSPAFRHAYSFYHTLFQQAYAPQLAEAQIANLYQEFAQGFFAMVITGPWNLAKFREKLPAPLQAQWTTAALPSPDGKHPGLSLAGGASLAISSQSTHPQEAWQLLEYLTEPAQQTAFYRLSGDLPSRQAAWLDPLLAQDPQLAAFRHQLTWVAPVPKIPEWERIADKIAQYAEKTVRGELTEDAALEALNRDAEQILEKRRWLLETGHE